MAALLRAGVPAAQVWHSSQAALAELSPRDRADLTFLWQVSQRVGGPPVLVLEQFQLAQRDAGRTHLQLAEANSVPQATRQVMLALPPVGFLVAQLSGLNPTAGILNPLGLGSVALAGLLVWLGARWSKSLMNRSEPASDDSVLLLATWLGLRAGLGVTTALAQAKSLGAEREFAEVSELDRLVELSAETGAPLASLLLSRADQLREEASSRALQLAQKMGVRLLLPLGLTVLPAFVLVTLVPIFISLVISSN